MGDFEWLPRAPEGIALLKEAGFFVAVVSNQRGVSLGTVSRETLSAIEDRVQSGLAAHGVRIDAFHYCIHDRDAGCDCRKPKPGLLLELAQEHDLSLEGSWMIGDDDTDVLAGKAAGCRTVLIGDGGACASAPDLTAEDLYEAAQAVAESG